MPKASASSRDEDKEPTTADLLAVLADHRRRGVRASSDVVNKGEKVLGVKGALRKMGDEVWPFLEQLGFAALDTGNYELAGVCIDRLETKFPKSPRVDALRGLLLQVTESKSKAKAFYEQRLAADENNILVRKRLIALHLNSSPSTDEDKVAGLSVQKGLELLVDHLDTVYTDHEGWSQLCDAYERLGMLQQCLSCLGDLMLLQPTNTFHVLRHAETLYTLGEYGPAYMGFCRALEMAGKMSDGGLGRRAGYGIKLCLRRLGSLSSETDASAASLSQAGDARKGKKKAIAAASTTDGDDSSLPKRAKDVDAMVAEQLLQAYSKGWSDPEDRVAGHDENKVLQLWLARQAQGPLKGLALA